MARIIDFVDGASSSTAPTLGDIVASELIQYANDAAYEAAEGGAPAAGNIYYNTTDNTIRYYDAGAAEWKVVPKTAADLPYDNSTSALTATDTQAAIDEVEGRVDQNETDISDLETLSGSPGLTSHASFTGTTIPDSSTTKDALQALETSVETKLDSSEKGAANGVASLDGSGRIPSAQLNVDAMEFKGSFDASGGGTGSPSLADGVGNTGDYYRVSVAGTVDHGAGNVTYGIGDSIIYSGSVWEKYTNAPLADTDSLPEGVTNLYNQTHTGEVTGATTLTVNPTAITNKTTVAPASGDFVLVSDTSDSGNLKKVDVADLGGAANVTTVTVTQTLLTTMEVVLADTTSGGMTLTLPTAVGVSGKVYQIKKVSSDNNVVVVGTSASQTIDGNTTTTVNTNGENLKVISDGANWEILDRRIPSEWVSFTPTGSWTTNSTYSGLWRRSGDCIELQYEIELSGAPNAAALSFNIPFGYTIDTSKIHIGGVSTAPIVSGDGFARDNTGASYTIRGIYTGSSTSLSAITYVHSNAPNDVTIRLVNNTVPFTWAASDTIAISAKVPISGWKG